MQPAIEFVDDPGPIRILNDLLLREGPLRIRPDWGAIEGDLIPQGAVAADGFVD